MVVSNMKLVSLRTFAFVLSFSLLSSSLWAQEEGLQSKRLWNFQDVDIITVIGEISRETGKNFIIDPAVRGNVTMVSGHEMDAEETYQVFLSLLQILGYAAVPGPNVIKIVPEANAKQLGLPVGTDFTPGLGDDMVLRVVKVHNVAAAQLLAALRPLVPQQGHLSAYPPTNVLIIGDRATNIDRLVQIIESVDQESTEEVEVIPIEHATAAELVALISSLEAGGGGQQREQVLAPLVLAADDRTNSVLLSGDPQRRLRAKVLIKHLDTPIKGTGNTEVIYLKYLQAESMAQILDGLANGYSTGAASSTSLPSRGINPIGGSGTGSSRYGGTSSSSSQFTGSSSTGGGTTGTNRTTGATGGGATTGATARGTRTNPFGQAATQGEGPAVAIQWEGDSNALVITAPPDMMRQLKTVIAQLDIRRAQVFLEAMIVEVSLDLAYQLGIEWEVNSGDFRASSRFTGDGTGDGDTPGFGQRGLNLGYFSGDFDIVLNALATNTAANVLSTPSLVTLDNEEAEIAVGQNIPIPTGTQSSLDSSPDNVFTTFERRDVGVILRVRPQINNADTLRLDIDQEVSTVVDPTTVNSEAGAVTNERRIVTTVLVDDGEILVLGGLIQDELNDTVSKVPFLGDIPLLGRLFRSDTRSSRKTNLLVFLRPVILRTPEDGILASTGKYYSMRHRQIQYEKYGMAALETGSGVPVLPYRDDLIELPPPFLKFDN